MWCHCFAVATWCLLAIPGQLGEINGWKGRVLQGRKECCWVLLLDWVWGWLVSFSNTILYTQLTLVKIISCTAHSFIELVEYVFSLPDVSLFLSQRISQDPLENSFGCQRQRGEGGGGHTTTLTCRNFKRTCRHCGLSTRLWRVLWRAIVGALRRWTKHC